jgi:hypothetical protein
MIRYVYPGSRLSQFFPSEIPETDPRFIKARDPISDPDPQHYRWIRLNSTDSERTSPACCPLMFPP